MGRPREHDDATGEALLSAAEHLLSRGEPLSVRVLAEATDTTTRAAYSVFGSINGVHQALLARAFTEIARRVGALPKTKNPAADLVRTGLEFRSFAVEHPNLFRIAFERNAPSHPRPAALGEVMMRALNTLSARV